MLLRGNPSTVLAHDPRNGHELHVDARVCVSVCVSVCVCLSVCLPACLSACLSVCLSVSELFQCRRVREKRTLACLNPETVWEGLKRV